ncbi:hypothetical protein DSUL_50183 [Desulfovibrionales bacterium]
MHIFIMHQFSNEPHMFSGYPDTPIHFTAQIINQSGTQKN